MDSAWFNYTFGLIRKSYDCLSSKGLQHLRVNHSLEFVNLDTGACANRIKSSWGAAKRAMNFSNRQKDHFSGHLAKYMFLKRCNKQKLDPFVEFLKLVGLTYSSLNPPSVDYSEDNSSHLGESEEGDLYEEEDII